MWLFFLNKVRLSGLLNAKSVAPVDLCWRSGTRVGKYNSSTRTMWKLSSMGWVSSNSMRTVSMHQCIVGQKPGTCPAVLCWRMIHFTSTSRLVHVPLQTLSRKDQGFGAWTQLSPRCFTKQFLWSLTVWFQCPLHVIVWLFSISVVRVKVYVVFCLLLVSYAWSQWDHFKSPLKKPNPCVEHYLTNWELPSCCELTSAAVI